MSNTLANPSAIPGWGVDAQPENDPTFPMRHIDQQQDRSLNWNRPQVQRSEVEILQSIEHLRQPAVVGTSTPPRGLSGMIRRVAFRRSESDWWHWLMLMGADRIDVVEGVIEDLSRGKLPNIPTEMGIRAEWQHNKQGLASKLTVAACAAVLIYAYARSRKPRAPTSRRNVVPD